MKRAAGGGEIRATAGGGCGVSPPVSATRMPPPPTPIPTASLASVNELGSAGARFVDNRFTNTTCSARWKSSDAVIANNSWANAGHNLEITYLQSWLEGPPLISNISLTGNMFYYGAGVNPIHPNAIDTSGIVEEKNLFLAQDLR